MSRNAVVAAGVKYEVDRRFVVDRTLEGWQGFINWFADWNWTATESEVVPASGIALLEGAPTAVTTQTDRLGRSGRLGRAAAMFD